MMTNRFEYDVLDKILANRPATGQIVQITGEPWVGKTRLLSELCARARSAGYAVTSGRAGGCHSDIPFETFIDALDDHFPPGDKTFSLLADDDGLALTGPAARYRLFRAVRGLLQRLAGTGGLVVALDDFHRADESSVELLTYLAGHPPNAPVILAVAYRSSLSGQRFDSMVRRERPADAVHLELGPLTEKETEALLPPGLSPLRRQVLHRDARGNPGALLTLLSTLSTPPDDDGAAGDYAARDLVDGLPPVISDPSFADLGMLSPQARQVAAAAAVSGDPFDPEIVKAVARLPEEVVLAGIDELQNEDIVRSAGTAGWFRFQHPIGRAVAYHSASAGWCYGAQSRVASVLKLRGAPAAVLAGHLEHLTPDEAANRQVLLAGARDTLCVMPSRAVRWLRRVLDAPGDAAAEAALLLAKAYAVQGRLADSLRTYRENWHRLAAAPEATRSDAVEWRARVHRLRGEDAQARRLLERELAAGPGSAPLILEQMALAIGTGDPGGDLAAWDEPTTGRTPPDPALHAHTLGLLALVRLGQGRAADAQQAAADCAALVDHLTDECLAGRMETLRWLGEAEARIGRVDEATAHLRRGLGFAVEHGQGYLQPYLTLALARIHHRLGDAARAAGQLAHAAAAARRSGCEPVLVAVADAEREIHAPHPGGRAAEIPAERPLRLVTLPAPARAAAAREHAGPDDNPATRHLETLSQREREVAGLVSIGCTNQQIASKLKLSQKTVETYLSRIFQKLGICSRAQIAHIVGQASVTA
jgi:DNA-binding CsgD family transcriptional regulator/tetratricopeptide (TPR) repeat protein